MSKTTIAKTEASLPIIRLSEDLFPRIKVYAQLGYSPERIASLLELSGRECEALVHRLTSNGDEFNQVYLNAMATGENVIDNELAKKAEKGDVEAAELLQARRNERNHLDLRRELLGF